MDHDELTRLLNSGTHEVADDGRLIITLPTAQAHRAAKLWNMAASELRVKRHAQWLAASRGLRVRVAIATRRLPRRALGSRARPTCRTARATRAGPAEPRPRCRRPFAGVRS